MKKWVPYRKACIPPKSFSKIIFFLCELVKVIFNDFLIKPIGMRTLGWSDLVISVWPIKIHNSLFQGELFRSAHYTTFFDRPHAGIENKIFSFWGRPILGNCLNTKFPFYKMTYTFSSINWKSSKQLLRFLIFRFYYCIYLLY